MYQHVKKSELPGAVGRKHAVGVRLTGLLLAVVIAASMLLPAAAAEDENLTITIRNNKGLQHMQAGQFTVYQLFRGTVADAENHGGSYDSEHHKNEFNAEHWNDRVLGNIEWGASVKDNGAALLTYLQSLTDPWAGGSANIFKEVTAPVQLAQLLEGKSQDFMQHFAAALIDHPGMAKLTEGSDYTETVNNQDDAADDTTVIDATSSGTGYYFFCEEEDSLDEKTEFIIAVLGSQIIDLKGTAPEVDKKICTGTDGRSYGDAVQTGDLVEFELTGTFAENVGDFSVYQYKFTDTLAKGFTYKAEVKVELENSSGQKYVISPSEYEVTPPAGADSKPAQDSTITFDFGDIKKGKDGKKGLSFTDMDPSNGSKGTVDISAGMTVHIFYKAQLNESAAVGAGEDGRGNVNDVTLTYSNDPDPEDNGNTTHTSPKEYVHVYTFGLDLKKVGDDLDHDTEGLQYAGFILIDNRDGSSTKGKMAKFADVNGTKMLEKWVDSSEGYEALYNAYKTAKEDYEKAPDSERSSKYAAYTAAIGNLSAYVLTSDANGKIPGAGGIDGGTYKLQEVVTPYGYNTAADIEFKIEPAFDPVTGELTSIKYFSSIDSDSDIATPEKDPGGYVKGDSAFTSGLMPQTIVNEQAPFLPLTGGTGAALVVGIGCLGFLIFAAAAKFSRKKDGGE